MRLALLLVVACSSSPPAPTNKPAPKPLVDAGAGSGSETGVRKVVIEVPFSLVVFNLEVIDTAVSPTTTSLARDFTTELRTAAHEYDGIGLGSSSHVLLDQKLMANCASEAPACMAKIATNVQADRIIWGTVEGPPYRSTIKLLVAETKYVVEWSTDSLDPNKLRETAREAMASLLSRSP